MLRRPRLLILTVPLLLAPLSCTVDGGAKLGNANLDDATCTARSDKAFNDCVDTCDTNYQNDDSCETAVASDFADKIDGIRSDLTALQTRPAFVDQVLSCIDDVDAQPDCGSVSSEVQQFMSDLGDRYGFDAGWLGSVVGTVTSGKCHFARIVAKGGCIMAHADEAADHYGELGTDLSNRMHNLGFDLASMLAGQVYCFAENTANSVAHTACVGAGTRGGDIGVLDPDLELGCYATEENTYESCRGECPAEPGTSCVPPGAPAWVDCGYWGQDLDGACTCIGDPIRAGVCRTFDWDRTWDRGYGTACELTVDGVQVRAARHFIVQHDDKGAPVGGRVACVPVDDFGMPCSMPGKQEGCPARVDR